MSLEEDEQTGPYPWKKRNTLACVQDLVVKRIDEGLGLLLEVPSEPAPTPGFVHISNAGEAKVEKLQQVQRSLAGCQSQVLFYMMYSSYHVLIL